MIHVANHSRLHPHRVSMGMGGGHQERPNLMALLDPPPPTKYNFLSLGAGVQSSAMALMAAHGEPTPDAAIFADTKAEPESVYRWLDWLEGEIQRCPHPFPVYRVTAGSLTEDSLKVRTSSKSGETYLSHNVPAYTLNSDGSSGNYRRQCTDKHKLTPLIRETNRLRDGHDCTVWIGISWDEIQRMKESARRGIQHRWPLIEMRMSRQQCKEWMVESGYPEPPRSACVYCPYHSDKEWRRLKDTDAESWAAAIEYEQRLQSAAESVPRLDGIPYLHPSLVPLAEVDLTDPDKDQMMLWQDFGNECEGMCGV